MTRWATLLLVLCCVEAGEAETLSLDQALTLAYQNNRNLQSSTLEADKARDRLEATRTRQFPAFNLYMLGAQQLRSFDFNLTRGVLGTYAGTGPLPSEDVHLKTPLAPTGIIMGRIQQPLSTLFRIHRNMDTLRTGITLAEEQSRADKQKLAREVKRVYYALQQVESSLRSVRETARLYEEVEKLTSRYVLQEVALRGDLLDAQTRVARVAQLETKLLNDHAAAREQLNQLLGRDVLTEFDVQPVLEASLAEETLEAARTRALSNRPEIRQAELREQQARQDLRAKKAESIPDVAAEFNALHFLNWGRFMPTQTLSVGVSLSWEPFDWGRKRHEGAEKQRTVNQAGLARKDAESQVLLDVNDKFRQLRHRRAELRVARMGRETAAEHLRVVNNKYAVNATLLKDVLENQASLEQSDSDYQQALTSFWNARADFERALGEDQ